jgi:signal transduction histidine kinase
MMGVSVDVSERKETEDTLRRQEQDLSKLTGRIINAQEEALRRLSRELHDDLTQRLAALALDAALIEKQLNPAQPQVVQNLKDLRTNLSEVAEEVHDLSRQLHPSILDDLGLVQAVQAEFAAFTKKTGIDLSFTHHDFPDSVAQPLALCLYRVIREGLQNIAKHSGARAVSITLQGLSDGIRLLIQDKGIGFDPKEVKKKAGIGLSSMRERVRLINGTISFKSKPGQGTEIEVFIPLGGEDDQATAADS